MVNDVWVNGSQWFIKGWRRRNSDHTPISLFLREFNWGHKPFRAFNVWLKKRDLIKMLQDESNMLIRNQGMDWFGILKSLKSKIKIWSTKIFEEMSREITELELKLSVMDKLKVDSGEKKIIFDRLREKYKIRGDMIR